MFYQDFRMLCLGFEMKAGEEAALIASLVVAIGKGLSLTPKYGW
jgi:hypothetical protein